MRKTLRVFLLVLLLTGSASAGIMQNDSPAPPPAQPASVMQEPTTDGVIHTPLKTDGVIPNDAASTFAQIVLNLLALS